jgi:hypothetical protein
MGATFVGSDEVRTVWRPFRSTSLYDAAQGLYSVLIGLVLTEPLKDAALDINRDPVHGNWTLRVLVTTMLVLAGVWLHVYMATFRMQAIQSPAGARHPALPGFRYVKRSGYLPGVLQYWLGIAQLTVIACMAYSIPNGRVFFAGGVVYASTIIVYELPFLNSHALSMALHPLELLRNLRQSAHLPILDDDVAAHFRLTSTALRNLLAETAVFEIVMACILLVVSATCFALVIRLPSMTLWIALLLLACVSLAVIVDYLLFPQFYLL